jgi:PAS domain S-box-containing protein
MASTDPRNHEFPEVEDALDKILESSLEGIAIIGDDKKIEYVNNRVCQILGCEQNEVIGQDFSMFVHQESSDLVTKRYASRLSRKPLPSTYDARILHSDGEARDVRINTSVMTDGEDSIKILAQIIDVTEEKRYRTALSEHETLYQTIVRTMNEGLGVIDDKGVLVQSNPALCNILGYTEKELIGKSTTDIMSGLTGDEVFSKIKERIAGKSGRYESLAIHKSGRPIPVMISAAPLLSETGEYTGSCFVVTDISRQKAMERHLQFARNRALLYLDLMRHDIRNHLQEIQVSAELLMLSSIDPSLSQLIENILNAVSKSAAIISDSRIMEEIAKLPLRNRVLDDVLCESLKDASILLDDVVISMSLHATEALIKADDYLELLVSDLLVTATHQNSSDKIRIWVELVDEGPCFVLSISDNGPGLPDGQKETLLDPSSRIEGVGFHLAHHIVDKYGGTIEVLDRVNGDPTQGKKIRVGFPKLD